MTRTLRFSAATSTTPNAPPPSATLAALAPPLRAKSVTVAHGRTRTAAIVCYVEQLQRTLCDAQALLTKTLRDAQSGTARRRTPRGTRAGSQVKRRRLRWKEGGENEATDKPPSLQVCGESTIVTLTHNHICHTAPLNPTEKRIELHELKQDDTVRNTSKNRNRRKKKKVEKAGGDFKCLNEKSDSEKRAKQAEARARKAEKIVQQRDLKIAAMQKLIDRKKCENMSEEAAHSDKLQVQVKISSLELQLNAEKARSEIASQHLALREKEVLELKEAKVALKMSLDEAQLKIQSSEPLTPNPQLHDMSTQTSPHLTTIPSTIVIRQPTPYTPFSTSQPQIPPLIWPPNSTSAFKKLLQC